VDNVLYLHIDVHMLLCIFLYGHCVYLKQIYNFRSTEYFAAINSRSSADSCCMEFPIE